MRNGVIIIINSEQIKISTLIVQIVSVVLIIMAYITTRSLVFVAGGICFLFLLSNVGWEQRYSLLFFLFPFCWVFTYKVGVTSVYMLLRIALLISVILYNRKIITTNYVLMCIILVFYLSAVSFGNFMESLKDIINILLWLTIGYVMQATIDADNILPIGRSFSNGVILSGIVGMNVSLIPNLQQQMRVMESVGYNDQVYSRFRGLFSDPNGFTIIVCMALYSAYYDLSKNKISVGEYSARAILLTFFGAMTMSKSCIILIVIYWVYVIFSVNNVKPIVKMFISSVIIGFAVYFLSTNPDWIQNMMLRFLRGKSYRSNISVNDITTGRTDIWGMYFDYLYHTNSWFWGNGLRAALLRGRGTHNTLLQLLYSVGLVGTIIYYKIIKYIYITVPQDKLISGSNKIGIWALLMLFATMFFLGGLLMEIYYYMLPLCFIYMKSYKENDISLT